MFTKQGNQTDIIGKKQKENYNKKNKTLKNDRKLQQQHIGTSCSEAFTNNNGSSTTIVLVPKP